MMRTRKRLLSALKREWTKKCLKVMVLVSMTAGSKEKTSAIYVKVGKAGGPGPGCGTKNIRDDDFSHS